MGRNNIQYNNLIFKREIKDIDKAEEKAKKVNSGRKKFECAPVTDKGLCH